VKEKPFRRAIWLLFARTYRTSGLADGGTLGPRQKEEIVRLARHQEEAEKSEHPLNRIINIDENADSIIINTTDIHLPRRIGEAVKRAFHGSLNEVFDEGGYFVRVNWAA
jgi:hypothetical protein